MSRPTLTMQTVRAKGGKTPTSPTPRTGDAADVDNTAAEITSQKRGQATLKAECLARDNNCCILTGIYDSIMAAKLLSDAEKQNVRTGPTEAAHIIPFSLATFTEQEVLSPSIPFLRLLTLSSFMLGL